MLSKRRLRQGKVRVTFTMPKAEFVERLHIVGDFNNWSVSATPMTREPDGSWTVALTLEGGRKYTFRYFGDGETWLNDWAADEYVPNEFGGENSVVNLENLGEPAAKPAATKKKVTAPKEPAMKKETTKRREATQKRATRSSKA
jgi:1,4-alpha-glucan branching enzyme